MRTREKDDNRTDPTSPACCCRRMCPCESAKKKRLKKKCRFVLWVLHNKVKRKKIKSRALFSFPYHCNKKIRIAWLDKRSRSIPLPWLHLFFLCSLSRTIVVCRCHKEASSVGFALVIENRPSARPISLSTKPSPFLANNPSIVPHLFLHTAIPTLPPNNPSAFLSDMQKKQ
jgi:hypothetical protein